MAEILNTYTFTLKVTDSEGNIATIPQTVIVYQIDSGSFTWTVLPNQVGT